MKLSILAVGLLFGLASAAPARHNEKTTSVKNAKPTSVKHVKTTPLNSVKATPINSVKPTATPIGDVEPVPVGGAKPASLNDVAIGYASLNGGTTGGAGGTTITVSTYDALVAAVASDEKKIVIITGPITQAAKQVKIGSNTSLIGKSKSAVLTGFGLIVKGKKNVIIRNLAIAKVLAVNGDAIGVQLSTNVWVDHVDVSSDQAHDKDFYDGLIDVTHAADWVTISNSYIHDHFKASLVGHSDANGAEDKGFLHVSYVNNYFKNIHSRGPSFRFGTGHIINNYYEGVADGVNTRQGAQVLVESNVFVNSKKPIFSTDAGFAVATGNDFGGAANEAPAGTLTKVPYTIAKVPNAALKAAVSDSAGATLSF